MRPSSSDIAEVNNVLALWSHLLDDQAWDRLDECLTADARYDATPLGFNRLEGLDAIRDGLSHGAHAVAHFTTNVLVLDGPGDDLKAVSKGLGLMNDRGVVSALKFVDRMRLTPAGWRICERVLSDLRGFVGRGE